MRMNLFTLLYRNLRYFRKASLTLAAGTAIGVAVLTGALVVGDSVRYSLRELALARLGGISYALTARGHLFRSTLADSISDATGIPVAAVLTVGGTAINPEGNLRQNRVSVIGAGERFFAFWPKGERLKSTGALISRNLAEKLNLDIGGELIVKFSDPASAFPDAPFLQGRTPVFTTRIRVEAISGDSGPGRFSLENSQQLPYTIILPIRQLCRLLKVGNRANLLLAGGGNGPAGISRLDSVFRRCGRLSDVGLTDPDPVRVPPTPPRAATFQINSSTVFFDSATARTVQSALPQAQPIRTYLVNTMRSGSHQTPYSFVTAADSSVLRASLGEQEIILTDWLANDLKVRRGDRITLTYFTARNSEKLAEDSAVFTVHSIVPVEGSIADPALMPRFPGISDAGNCSDWDAGSPVDLKRIRPCDEDYWKRYRGTPKAFISAEAGKRLWNNRFGTITAFRFQADPGTIPGIERSLMQQIPLSSRGLSFRPVRQEALEAASGTTDFGVLFLSLSFFLLAGSLLLTGLLFSYHAGSRIPEIAVLSGAGFSRPAIVRLFIYEGILISLLGILPGIAAGIGYNALLIKALNTVWQGAVQTSELTVSLKFSTLVISGFTGLLLTNLVTSVILYRTLRKPLALAIKGNSPGLTEEPAMDTPGKTHKLWLPAAFPPTALVTALVLVFIARINTENASPALLLSAGALILAGLLGFLNHFLRTTRHPSVTVPTLAALLIRSISRNRYRFLSVAAILAAGTFSILITGANRPGMPTLPSDRTGGTGGFTLWGESTTALLKADWQDNLPTEGIARPARFFRLPVLQGDDASCLNLNQVQRPSLLGIPAAEFNRSGRFSFTTAAGAAGGHPWEFLRHPLAPGVIPGIADQTVITWGIRKSIGDTLTYDDGYGNSVKVVLAGGLESSIFQGYLLVSDSLLRTAFPTGTVTRVILAEVPLDKADTLARELEERFSDFGMTVEPAARRLAAFQVVTGTYLSVFLLLGGLGLVLGTFGFGILVLRNLQARRRELSLMQLLGFRAGTVRLLIATEHLLLLFTGLATGIAAALPSILAASSSNMERFPWAMALIILGAVVLNGIAWIFFASGNINSTKNSFDLREE